MISIQKEKKNGGSIHQTETQKWFFSSYAYVRGKYLIHPLPFLILSLLNHAFLNWINIIVYLMVELWGRFTQIFKNTSTFWYGTLRSHLTAFLLWFYSISKLSDHSACCYFTHTIGTDSHTSDYFDLSNIEPKVFDIIIRVDGKKLQIWINCCGAVCTFGYFQTGQRSAQTVSGPYVSLHEIAGGYHVEQLFGNWFKCDHWRMFMEAMRH